jgi:PAS domain S-box-containing protein
VKGAGSAAVGSASTRTAATLELEGSGSLRGINPAEKLPSLRFQKEGDKMKPATILVVEDESIVAGDLQNRLINMGYSVPTTSPSGEDALRKAKLLAPDLVLMDIRLKGEMDGVEAAEQMRDLFDVPCIYLTAYTDDDTLRRAKITEPYGYIVKPFDERELHTAIEMALYRHKTEQKLKEKEQWLSAIVPNLQDAVIVTSGKGVVVSMNPAAEILTGWSQADADGKDVKTVFNVSSIGSDSHVENPASEILADPASAKVEKRLCLITKGGGSVSVDCRAVAVHGEKTNLKGIAVIFRRSEESK